MLPPFSAETPIFQQIAEAIEDAIVTGAFPEEEQVPSTTEVSTRMRVNPATVLKGMNLLVDRDILYKKRGVGMFVRRGAVSRILAERKEAFFSEYITPMLQEAAKLGISSEEIRAMIERGHTT